MAIAAVADVGDFDRFGAAIGSAAAQLGAIDILVNNAGNRGADIAPGPQRPFWERLGGRFGITANCVALGATRTPAIADPEFAAKVLSGYLIRRFGEPDDAANMILFLASDVAGWVTGQTIPVNGGYSLTL